MLSDQSIRRMKLPEAGQREIADGSIKGMTLRVSHGGTRTFYFTFRNPVDGRQARVKIGEYPGLTLGDARDQARALRAMVDRGLDPRAETRARKDEVARREAEVAANTLGRRITEYLAYCRRRGLRTAGERERHFMVYLPADWRDRPLDGFTRADIEGLLQAIEERGPVQANRVVETVRALFSWAARKGFMAANPALGVKSDIPEVARDRVLTDAELVAVWRASRSLTPIPGAFVRFLALTGQRRNEVATMCWADVDLDQALWTIPKETAKMGRAHHVPLAPMALALLASLPRSEGYVFSTDGGATHWQAFSKMKARLDALTGDAVAPWRLHDSRRSVASGLARLGTAPHVIEKVLAHQHAISGIAAVYNRHDYGDEKRQALTAWADHVAGLLGGSNVVALARPRR